MKNLKLLILAFAALGLGIMVSSFEQFKALATHPLDNGGGGLISILGLVLPLVMGILGLVRPPFARWQALVSLGGFAAIAVKGRIWEELPKLMDYSTKSKLALLAVVGGIVVSALALAKPEDE